MKKFLNKITSILLAVCMFFMLSACNTTTGTEVPSVTTTTEKTTATTVTTTIPVETDKTEEFVTTTSKVTTEESSSSKKTRPSSEISVPPSSVQFTSPNDSELPAGTEFVTSTMETNSETNLTVPAVNEISTIDLVTFPSETPSTEIDSMAILLTSLKLELATGHTISNIVANNCPFSVFSNNIDVDNTFLTDWGCYPSVLISAFSKFSYKKFMIDLTGCSSNKLYSYIDSELPVMVWVTEDLAKPEIVFSSEKVKLYGPKDTVILVGYSDTHVKVWSTLKNDYVTYDRNLFEQRFEEMGSMALVVDPNS